MRYLVLVALVVGIGCASTGGTTRGSNQSVPDAGYLRARVERLYAAEQANDWAAWFQMASPELKTEEGKKEFQNGVRGGRDFKIIEFRIKRISAVPAPEGASDADAGAAVAMDVMVEENGQQHKEEDQTDYWVRVKGEWYWTWRGWPDD